MPNQKPVEPIKEDARPPIWIGHVTLTVSNVEMAADFYRKLGLRPILDREELSILELRGGTHLLLFRGDAKPTGGPVRNFDFMVDDIEASHSMFEKAGIAATPIAEDQIAHHLWFDVTDPDGYVIRIFSSHAEGRCV